MARRRKTPKEVEVLPDSTATNLETKSQTHEPSNSKATVEASASKPATDDEASPPPAPEPDSKRQKTAVEPTMLRLNYHQGDIFSAPPNALLIHACNTQGSWGAGIAAAFKDRYPAAYQVYNSHCIKAHNPRTDPVETGSALLIPPSETDEASQHYIGCLFTSARYGRAKDRPEEILTATGSAVRDLLQQVREMEKDGKEVSGVRMCKINSARFGVPWERTVEVLEGIEIHEGWRGDVEVWSIE